MWMVKPKPLLSLINKVSILAGELLVAFASFTSNCICSWPTTKSHPTMFRVLKTKGPILRLHGPCILWVTMTQHVQSEPALPFCYFKLFSNEPASHILARWGVGESFSATVQTCLIVGHTTRLRHLLHPHYQGFWSYSTSTTHLLRSTAIFQEYLQLQIYSPLLQNSAL